VSSDDIDLSEFETDSEAAGLPPTAADLPKSGRHISYFPIRPLSNDAWSADLSASSHSAVMSFSCGEVQTKTAVSANRTVRSEGRWASVTPTLFLN
jgi:hypothetical protein